jgi:hypothetical protein
MQGRSGGRATTLRFKQGAYNSSQTWLCDLDHRCFAALIRPMQSAIVPERGKTHPAARNPAIWACQQAIARAAALRRCRARFWEDRKAAMSDSGGELVFNLETTILRPRRAMAKPLREESAHAFAPALSSEPANCYCGVATFLASALLPSLVTTFARVVFPASSSARAFAT